MKKVIKGLMCIALMTLMLIPNVKADDKLNAFVAKLKEVQKLEDYQELKDLLGITMIYDEATSTDSLVNIKITDEDGESKTISYQYANGVLTYTAPDSIKTNVMTAFLAAYSEILVLNAAFLNSGYTQDEYERWINSDESMENLTLDQNGVEEQHETITETFDGGTSTMTYTKALKVKVDNIKVTIPEIVIPSITVTRGNENAITLKVSTQDGKDNDTCYIYKSSSTEYELFATTECNSTITDVQVEKGKTYFYKVSKDKKNFSMPTMGIPYVENVGSETTPTTTVVSNPKTGVYDHILELVGIVGIAGIALTILKKKALFKRL